MSDWRDMFPYFDKESGFIRIYPPKACMLCDDLVDNYVWKEMVTSKSKYLEPGTIISMRFLRVCTRCERNHSNEYMWG